MAKRKLITQDQKKRIADLLAKGLSDSEVAGAMKINSETVRKYRLDNNIIAKKAKKIVRKLDKNIGSEKTDRDDGAGAPGDPLYNKGGREPDDHTTGDHSIGKAICFTGGRKKHGGDTMKNEEKEEKDYTCPKCGGEFNGKPVKCPSCGVDLEW